MSTNQAAPAPGVPLRLPRIVSVDVARAIAIACMILVHVLMVYADPETSASPFGQVVEFLGGPPAAPVFMLLMGLSFGYGSPKPLSVGLRRAAFVFGLGYLLNLLREVLPLLAARAFMPELAGELIGEGQSWLDLLLIGDILQFAGPALAILAVLRALKAPGAVLLVLAAAVTAAAPFLWGIQTGFAPADRLLDILWGHRPLGWALENAISFPVFPWLSFPLVGMALGARLRTASDPARLIRRAGIAGAALAAAGLVAIAFDPAWQWNDYYHSRPGAMVFMVGFALAWLALIDLAVRNRPQNGLLGFCGFWSARVTVVYFAQWLIIVWGMALVDYGSAGPAEVVAFSVTVALLSSGAAWAAGRLERPKPRPATP